MQEAKETTQKMVDEISSLRNDYRFEAMYGIEEKKAGYKEIAEDLGRVIDRINKMVLLGNNGSCPACDSGLLVCDSCGYEEYSNPNPPTLSNTDAFLSCSCPACDGGILACCKCDYTFNSIKGYYEGTF